MYPEEKLLCSCEAVSISPIIGEISFEQQMVIGTKLIAKASPKQSKPKKWWQVW
jgi:hypothetical protein